MRRFVRSATIAACACAVALPVAGGSQWLPFAPLTHAPLTTIATDPFGDAGAQHATVVEPDTFAAGSTIVAAAQLGRFYDGGAADIGFSTSTDGGATWTSGLLPGITKVTNKSDAFDRASDPTVAYDPVHGRWLIAGLPIRGTTGQTPFVSASSDGKTWGNPVQVGVDNGDFMDKDWIACDGGTSSPHAGTCYVEFDDASLGDQVMMTASTDGGKTWSTPQQIANAGGLGGQPLVQPNGNVVVPFLEDAGSIGSFRSTDGGKTWSGAVAIASENDHQVAGGLRSEPLPSAEIDGAGKIYVAWQDCSFRASCTANDIVYVTSSDGTSWSAKQRVPIDKTTSTVDHFIPGLAVDRATAGATAHLGLTYYYYPKANCATATCALTVGYVASTNGGATWTRPRKLSAPMKTTWLANTSSGYMVGDYISTSFAGTGTHAAFAVANAPSGSTFDEFLTSTAAAEPAVREAVEFSSAGERPLPGARSDHVRKRFPPLL